MTMLNDLPEELRNKIIEHWLKDYKGTNQSVKQSSIAGYYGAIYLISGPQIDLVAKCPRFKSFASPEEKKSYVLKAIEEFAKSLTYYHNPFVNRVFDIELIHNWPFIFWRFQEATLTDLIGDPQSWTFLQKHAVLIMVIEGLLRARSQGLTAHQDLKPENIFVTDISRRIIEPELIELAKSTVDRYRPVLADFATADAFVETGRMAGSMPYKAPEQYDHASNSDLALAHKIDDFALAVIISEVFSDGLHPIGRKTQDVWPAEHGPYKHDHKWKKWARSKEKTLPHFTLPLPDALSAALLSGMDVEPKQRSTLFEMQNALWASLEQSDGKAAEWLRRQIERDLSFYKEAGWPYLEERLRSIRDYYSNDFQWT